ncbi:MAG: hypothetical protein HKN14_09855 [Marinicaulis sp.]|nr:hypothetical protein [Marinicaulis sp.]NNE41206.1 hypothetical protein [Marinicaulis sp.]NNL88366.1 hypothetical protein [Marinicaulis sp.]
MKKLTVLALSASFMAAPAFAGDLEAYCLEVTADGGDPSGCACLAESADDAMTEELLAVEGEADMEGLSDASKGAIAACWPDS